MKQFPKQILQLCQTLAKWIIWFYHYQSIQWQ